LKQNSESLASLIWLGETHHKYRTKKQSKLAMSMTKVQQLPTAQSANGCASLLIPLSHSIHITLEAIIFAFSIVVVTGFEGRFLTG